MAFKLPKKVLHRQFLVYRDYAITFFLYHTSKFINKIGYFNHSVFHLIQVATRSQRIYDTAAWVLHGYCLHFEGGILVFFYYWLWLIQIVCFNACQMRGKERHLGHKVSVQNWMSSYFRLAIRQDGSQWTFYHRDHK